MKKEKGFSYSDFGRIEGYFLDEELARDIEITDFEYTINNMKLSRNDKTAFISFTKESLKAALGVEKNWPNVEVYVKANYMSIALYVTEVPIEELSSTLAQFIVPNVWEFMHQVGSYIRERVDIPIIAITGSVGKTTTRMMIEHLLNEDYRVLSNRGNHNTRFAIPLYMSKLVQDPDILSLEVSLNALNNRGKGPQSTFIKPTIAVLTSVGAAHMSTMKNIDHLTRHKANIFKGLDTRGIAIINFDIPLEQRKIVFTAAKEQTDRIFTYSMLNPSADVFLVSMEESKDLSKITISMGGKLYTYHLKLASKGIVENSLASILVLKAMGLEPDKYLQRFADFCSLPKIMEKKIGTINGRKVTIIDDTHNAAIPSMINAINSFGSRAHYYNGKKILVLGQVADLGRFSDSLHEMLMPYINESGADLLLGYGEAMRKVVSEANISSKWYSTMDEYLEALVKEIVEDSFILLKGSVSASDYNRISPLLDKLLVKM